MKHTYCVACESTDNLQHHHLLPRIKGGTDESSNLITLCGFCHGIYHNLNFRDHSHLTKIGLQKAKDKGVVLGRGDKLEVAKAAKDFALTIIPYLEKYKKHQGKGKNLSLNAYAKLLNEDDIHTRNGGHWQATQIHRLIGYAGRHDLTNGKKKAVA